jgi:UDP-N-acetyl-2-amino-2-deoxyglucuronate dehydrogenase
MQEIGLALVGCGAIAEWHRMALANVPTLEIRACVDPLRERAEAMAKLTGGAAFTSLAEALAAPGVEAADVMVPHHLHEPIALEVLRAGKHLLLEKPMATSLAACERILAAARASGRVFMVGENAQYWPDVLLAKQLLDSGAIGTPVTAHVHLFSPAMNEFHAAGSWRLSRELMGGGIALDTGSHFMRPLRMWLGEVDEVVAVMERPIARMEGESLARALFRFRGGAVASFCLFMSDGALAPQDTFRITGTQGEITIAAGVRLFDGSDPRGRVVQPDRPEAMKDVPAGYMASYAGEFLDFARAIREGKALAAGPEVAVGELRIAQAMERSAQTRRWEKVWE